MHGTIVVSIIFSATLVGAPPTPAEVFNTRIVPIFRSPNPSSCMECHLSGVDLKNYILPDAEKTFRSLRDQGLIDLTDPAQSKIVKLIDMDGGKPTSVNAALRKAEREAFLDWIRVCAADPTLKMTPVLAEAERAQPARPSEVIRHARKDRVLASFEQNVWAWRFRCMNCHTEGTPQCDKLRKEHGDRVAWVRKAGAEATLEYLLASKLIDAAKPEQSLLLRKPLGDKHGGGVKFTVGDQAYQGFRAWIDDVAAMRSDRYPNAKALPAAETGPSQFGTDLWFRLTDCPPTWGGKLLQVRIFAWDPVGKSWQPTPIATSDRVVSAQAKLWQHTLTLLAERGSAQAKAWRTRTPTLPDGKYLVRVSLTTDGKTVEVEGQAEFSAVWKPGYGQAVIVNASKFGK